MVLGDSTLDNTTSFKVVELKAHRLTKKHSKAANDKKNIGIDQWLINANKIAKTHVYTKNILKELKQNEINNSKQPVIIISNSYDKQARKIAELQIVKSGFQLAEILNQIN